MAASYPIECKVCHEHYDLEHRRPRSLPCGHPFCSACITNMINVGELTCPICCTKHKATIPTQFPINYGMEEIIGSFENIKITMPTSAQPDQGCLGGIGKKLQSLIQEQQNSLSNLSAVNQDMVHQLGVYEAQLLEWQSDHYQLLTVLNDSAELLQKELSSVQTLKKNGEEQEKQQQSMLKHVTSVTTAQEALIALEETELCNTEVESWVQKCRNLFPNVGIIRSSMKVNEILRKTLEFFNEEESSSTVCQSDLESPVVHGEDSSTTIIEKMKQVTSVSVKKSRHVNSEVRDLSSSGNVYAVRKKSDGNCTYYRMTREKGKVHLFSQEKRLPLSFHTVQYEVLSGLLELSSALVFFDFDEHVQYNSAVWFHQSFDRIYIRLGSMTLCTKQFMLLCTGELNHSYKASKRLNVDNKGQPGECVWFGDYEKNNGSGGAPLVAGLKDQPTCWTPVTAGTVSTWYPLGGPRSTQFRIFTRDADFSVPYVIGKVETGLECVQACVQAFQIIVKDCGVVLSV